VLARHWWGCVLFALACSEDQPSLVLRCEEGRVSAYLVLGMAAEADAGSIDPDAVQVELDSAPPCAGTAP
jgi:hypothetical protein